MLYAWAGVTCYEVLNTRTPNVHGLSNSVVAAFKSKFFSTFPREGCANITLPKTMRYSGFGTIFRGWECSHSIRSEILLRYWCPDFFPTFSKKIGRSKKTFFERFFSSKFSNLKYRKNQNLKKKSEKSKIRKISKNRKSQKSWKEKISTTKSTFFEKHFFVFISKLTGPCETKISSKLLLVTEKNAKNTEKHRKSRKDELTGMEKSQNWKQKRVRASAVILRYRTSANSQ